jgi:hypothetical protein
MMVSVVSKTLFGLGFAAALLVAGSALAQTPQVATDAKAGMTAKTKTAVPLDINTASVAELQALKGVGDKRAADIVKGRPYKDPPAERLQRHQGPDHRQAEVAARRHAVPTGGAAGARFLYDALSRGHGPARGTRGSRMLTTDEDILHAAQAWREAGRAVAIATVVETWGSAPRPVGSHLVIDAEGMFLGSVSGGCVEGDVVVEALDVIEAGAPRLLEFGVADDAAWKAGLSCGGRIKVYVERLD